MLQQEASFAAATALSRRNTSGFVTYLGQLLADDIVSISTGTLGEWQNISAPAGDPFLDPTGTNTVTIPFLRSAYSATPTSASWFRRDPVNEVTAFIDGSAIYGSSDAVTASLRRFVGGRLLTDGDAGLPLNIAGAGMRTLAGRESVMRAAGERRANQNPGLLAMHTLFAREHNRLADTFAAASPTWSDEQLFQVRERGGGDWGGGRARACALCPGHVRACGVVREGSGDACTRLTPYGREAATLEPRKGSAWPRM